MAVDLNGIFRRIASRSSHEHQKDLIDRLISIINISVMDRVTRSFRESLLSRGAEHFFRNFHRVLTADPHDPDPGISHRRRDRCNRICIFHNLHPDIPAACFIFQTDSIAIFPVPHILEAELLSSDPAAIRFPKCTGIHTICHPIIAQRGCHRQPLFHSDMLVLFLLTTSIFVSGCSLTSLVSRSSLPALFLL